MNHTRGIKNAVGGIAVTAAGIIGFVSTADAHIGSGQADCHGWSISFRDFFSDGPTNGGWRTGYTADLDAHYLVLGGQGPGNFSDSGTWDPSKPHRLAWWSDYVGVSGVINTEPCITTTTTAPTTTTTEQVTTTTEETTTSTSTSTSTTSPMTTTTLPGSTTTSVPVTTVPASTTSSTSSTSPSSSTTVPSSTSSTAPPVQPPAPPVPPSAAGGLPSTGAHEVLGSAVLGGIALLVGSALLWFSRRRGESS